MNTPASLRSRNSWIRSSRLWTIAAGVLAGLCLIVLFVWSANDASFRSALLQWEVSLGLQKLLLTAPVPDGDWGLNDPLRSIRWDGLGKRVIALHLLVWTGVAATALFAVLAFRPPKVRRLLAAVGLVVGWGLLCGTQTLVDDWRARRQVAAIFPRIEEAGLALSQKWPTESGRIPPDIEIYIAEKFPNVLLVLRGEHEQYPFRETIGGMIKRGTGGIISFQLEASHEMAVEYHPDGTLPLMQKDGGFGFPTPPVLRYYRIKDSWYLVRYGGM